MILGLPLRAFVQMCDARHGPCHSLTTHPASHAKRSSTGRQIQPFSHSKGPHGLPPLPSSGLYQKALPSRGVRCLALLMYINGPPAQLVGVSGEEDEGLCRCNMKQGVRVWHGLRLSRRGSVLGSVWSADAPAIRMIATVPRCCWSRSVQRAYISVKWASCADPAAAWPNHSTLATLAACIARL